MLSSIQRALKAAFDKRRQEAAEKAARKKEESENKVIMKRISLEESATTPEAQMRIGHSYAMGKKPFYFNLQEAKKWFEKAADQKYFPAKVELAKLCMDQDDYPQAWKLLNEVRSQKGVDDQKWFQEAKKWTSFLDSPEEFDKSSRYFMSPEENRVMFLLLMAAVNPAYLSSPGEKQNLQKNVKKFVSGKTDLLQNDDPWWEVYMQGYKFEEVPFDKEPWYLKFLPPESQDLIKDAINERRRTAIQAIVFASFAGDKEAATDILPKELVQMVLSYLPSSKMPEEKASALPSASSVSSSAPVQDSAAAPAVIPAPTAPHVSTPAMRRRQG